MSIYSIPPLISALLFFALGIFVLLKNIKSTVNRIFGWSCLTTFIWQFAWTVLFSIKDPALAQLLVKIGYSGIIFIPVSFYHFTMSYLQEKHERKLILISYFLSIVFLIVLWTSKLFINGYYVYFWGWYPKASFLHPFYLFLLFFLATRGLWILIIKAKRLKNSPFSYNQIKYLFLAFVIYCFAATDFLVNYGIEFYPLGFVAILVSLVIIGYSIAKYHLLDINIALTRAGIFTVVYLAVLGIPYWIGFKILGKGLWILPVSIMAIFATIGPFIYLFLQHHTEELLLKDQRRYQKALKELSKTMTRIRDLDKLIKAIVSTVVDTVKIPFAAIYLKDEEYKSYRLKHYYPKKEQKRFQEFIPLDYSLVNTLYAQKRPLLSEEISTQDKIDLDSGLVVPCFIEEDKLLGFMVLGQKPNNQIYTPDDIIVFETLSYSTSLAIENSQFWKEIEEHQRQSRIQDMDLFSYSLAHEIDNPMSSIKVIVAYLKDYFLKKLNLAPEEQKELESAFNSILEAQNRVSGMVKAVEEFGKKTKAEFGLLKLDDIIKSYLDLYLPQFKYHGISFTKEIPEKIPYLRGSKQELMQVLVNFSNNSIHALLGTKEKKIHLKVEIPNQDFIRIILKDNGYGIRQEKLETIFAPFVTSKASTEGKGMGLYTIRRIIERHKGKVWAESEGKDKGASFIVELPIAKDITEEDFKKEDKGKRIF